MTNENERAEIKRWGEGGKERGRERERERKRVCCSPSLRLSVSPSLRLLGSLLLIALCTVNAFAQRATGVITGRVVTDDGQPVRHATISISSVGGGGRR